ncbi:MAG: hypothetical protein ACI8UO_002534 [Verrucomicrobiales bacterium]|jgi:hypothetical protein
MKRIALDYLWRWKWAFLIGVVTHFVAMIVGCQPGFQAVPIGVIAGSAMLLLFELNRGGGARTLLSLPVTSKQLARVWRFTTFEFPTSLFLVVLGLSMLVSWLIKPTHLHSFDRFFIIAVFQTGMIGTIFFGFTGMPTGPADHRRFRDKARAGLYGLLWGFSIPGTIFAAKHLPESLADLEFGHIFVAGCLTLMSAIGWFRAEALVIKRAQQLNRSEKEKASGSTPSPPQPGFGGLPYLCLFFGRRTCLLGIAMVLFNWFGMQFLMSRTSSGLDTGFTASQVNFVAPVMALVTAIIMFTQLRSLRILPLSKSRITSMLVVWPMTLAIVFSLMIVGLHYLFFGGPVLWIQFTGSVIATSAILLIVPSLLWFGFSKKAFLIMILVLPAIQLLGPLLKNESGDFANFALWIPPLLVAISFAVSYRLLDSSRAWRPNAFRLMNLRRHA